MSLASGVLIDRYGYRWSLGVGMVLLGVAQAARGLVSEFLPMLLLTLLLGVGATGVTFGLPKLVSDLFPPERSGTFSSVYIVAASTGSAAAFTVGRPVLGPALGGWRQAFVATGVAVAGFAILWAVVSWVGVVHAAPNGDGTDDGDDGFTLATVGADVRQLLAHQELRLLIILAVVYLLLTQYSGMASDYSQG